MKLQVNDWIIKGCDLADGISLAKSLNLPDHFISLCISDTDFIPSLRIMICHKAGIKTSAGLTLREEFPFINDKSCPVELKALVTEKFSTFYRYKQLHSALFDCCSLEDCKNTAAALIDAYTDNRSVYAELDYFRNTGKVLGKHPFVKHFYTVQELRVMPIKKLIAIKSRLEFNIWRINKELAKNDKPHLTSSRKERLDISRSELLLVNNIINDR